MNWKKHIHSPRPTFQILNFESLDELGKVIFQCKLIVDNKMGKSSEGGNRESKRNQERIEITEKIRLKRVMK